MEAPLNSRLFNEDSPAKVAEYLRQTLQLMATHGIPACPVNYDLCYTYIAGKNVLLNEKLSPLLDAENAWDADVAQQLYNRFFLPDADHCFEEIRDELIKLVARSLGALDEVAGKTSVNNDKLQVQVDLLAAAKSSEDIVNSVALILDATREFITQSRQLEQDLVEASQQVNSLKSELDAARQEAMTDTLTGLHNRRGFNTALKALINACEPGQHCFSLLIADLDHFKRINDKHGHLIGDKVLSEFAKTLARHATDEDYLARFGGEEFVMLLPEKSLQQASSVADSIRLAVDKQRIKLLQTNKTIFDLTVSLGVVQYHHGEAADSLLGRCDRALYQAKRNGRNCVVTAD